MSGTTDGPALAAYAPAAMARLRAGWRETTRRTCDALLRGAVLPALGGLPVGRIAEEDLRAWMDGMSDRPAAANRALAVVSGILREAEADGLRAEGTSGPWRGLRHRLHPRDHPMTDDDLRTLGRALAAHEGRWPAAVGLARLLLYTGCRQTEIRTLRRDQVHGTHIRLDAAKAGPRTIWLAPPARRALRALPRRSDVWLVATARTPEAPMSHGALHHRWRAIRTAAGMPALRLHDLRHAYATCALRWGEGLPTIGRLLGHRSLGSTTRYLHADQLTLSRAADAATAAAGWG